MPKGKKSKFKLPKVIAGIEVPKSLRDSSDSLLDFLNTPQGREVAAAALVAIAGALAGGDRVKKLVAGLGQQAAEAGSAGGAIAREVTTDAVEAVEGAVAKAAETLLPSTKGRKKAPPAAAPAADGTEAAPRNARSRSRKAALATTSLTGPATVPELDQKKT
ncbi:hypothetical protein [Azospirillum sp. SYSU D00513]|uniref:hypothetical protein n=1 Tax=Azospirillum sp. SYSU D00513 TaxID=2812561 RepID=UPI001A971483|nr:hypothetical protein [Azospirillum sp. SYSU D00513]